MNRRLTRIAVVLIAAAVALPACSSSKSGGTSTPPASSVTTSSPTPSASSTTTPAAAVISIQGFVFTVPDSVAPGEKITVQNKDDTAHTVTADTGNAFDVKVPGSATVTFTAPVTAGSYKFHCTYHSNMHATLIVK